VPCDGSSVNRSRGRPSCSRRSAAHRLRQPGSPAWLNELARRPNCLSSPIHTCCVTLAAMRWRTEGTIRGRSKPTLDTATSSTRCAIPKCRRCGSRTFGDANPQNRRRAKTRFASSDRVRKSRTSQALWESVAGASTAHSKAPVKLAKACVDAVCR
jgi:hypothetical protein